jgi:hypothetical protein
MFLLAVLAAHMESVQLDLREPPTDIPDTSDVAHEGLSSPDAAAAEDGDGNVALAEPDASTP